MRDEPVRASDQEREQCLEVLKSAMAEGMLDVAEFDERCARATAARTRGELAELLADLPVAGGAGQVTESEEDTAEFTGTFSPLKRTGSWHVPRKLVIRKNLGSTELDFTETQIEHPVVDIELEINAGSVELRVPDEASVDLDGVQLMAASAQEHRKTAPRNGKPHFRITGKLRFGSLEVRGRRWRALRWLTG